MLRWLKQIVTAPPERPDFLVTAPAGRVPDGHARAARELLAVNEHFDRFISEFDSARTRSKARARKVSLAAQRS